MVKIGRMIKHILSALFLISSLVLISAGEPRIKSPPMGVDNSPATTERARKRGAETAAADIKAGRAVILYYGEPWSSGKPLLDDATGLPVVIVGGCTVMPPFVAEVEAYNATIRAWHARLAPTATPR